MSVRTYEQISDLPTGITPVTGTELVELEQDGVSRKFTMTELSGITAPHQGTHQFGGSDPIGTHDQVANAIPYLNADGKIDDHVSDASTTAKGKIQLATDGGTTSGTAVQANDGRLSNARAPTNHASAHYGVGGDLIPNATTEASGLMSNGDKTKLDNYLPTADEKAALIGVGGTPSASNKYVTDADGRLPTAGEKAALAGSYGTPGGANKYVTETDPILGGLAADTTVIENWASFFRMFGAPEKIYDWSELGSGVLACGAFYKGTLFCGTNGGTIYRQNADGTFSEYQELQRIDQTLPHLNIMFTDGTNFYIAELPGDIYKMDSSGVFQATGQTERAWTGLAMHKGYLYATVSAGDIYKMDDDGVMQATGQTSRHWWGLASDGTNLYASAMSVPGDIYKMDGSGVFQATGQTAREWGRLCIYKSVLYATIVYGGVYRMNSSGTMIDTGCSASDGIDRIFKDMFTDGTYFYSVDSKSGDIYSFANKTPSINIPAVGTLPIPSTFPIGGRKVIRRLSAYDGNAITITPPSGATIEGLSDYRLYEQYASVTIERVSATLFAIVGEGIQKITEVGKIEAFCRTLPKGFKACDGSAISRATFPALFSAIGTTFGAGDGSTTFNLPDLRETVLVGTGTRGAGVTAHDTYTLGQFKDDQMQGHWHLVTNNSGYSTSEMGLAPGSITGWSIAGGNSATARTFLTDGENGEPRTGSTTHGKQLGVNYAIRYA